MLDHRARSDAPTIAIDFARNTLSVERNTPSLATLVSPCDTNPP